MTPTKPLPEIEIPRPVSDSAEAWKEYAEALEAKLAAKEERDFIGSFDTVQRWAYRINKMNGFHDKKRSPLEAIALIHSELSELLEAYRKGTEQEASGHIGDDGYMQVEEELADVIIRCMDFAEEFTSHTPGQPNDVKAILGAAISAKISYNSKRRHRHGGKLY